VVNGSLYFALGALFGATKRQRHFRDYAGYWRAVDDTYSDSSYVGIVYTQDTVVGCLALYCMRLCSLVHGLFAPPKGSEHRNMVDQFITTMKTPIDFDAEIGQGNDLAQLKVIGWFGAAIAVFIALMLIIPNPVDGRLAITTLALIIGSVSALMIKAGSKQLRSKNK